MRKYILIALAVLLLLFSFLWARKIANTEKPQPQTTKQSDMVVFADTVYNATIPIRFPATGTLYAKERVEIFAEVGGLFQNSARDFRAGQAYNRGEILLQINASEYAASVKAARSNLQNAIASMMPDLKMDFPEAYAQWQVYLSNFSVEKTLTALPNATSEQERFFIAGRNINAQYYNIKQMEERLAKYTVRAPFNGILTEAVVSRGSTIRPGQKLGEFINPSLFEMELSVPISLTPLLIVGKEVALNSINNNNSFTGKLTRINAKIDQSTQTVKAYIEAKGDGLKEGMFLEATLIGKEKQNAFAFPRQLLIDEKYIYTIQNNVAKLMEVEVVFSTDRNVIAQGIPDGTIIVSRPQPGLFEGQTVVINQEQ